MSKKDKKLNIFEWNLKHARKDIAAYFQELKDMKYDDLASWYHKDIVDLVIQDDFPSSDLIERVFFVYEPRIKRIITDDERYTQIKYSFFKVATGDY